MQRQQIFYKLAGRMAEARRQRRSAGAQRQDEQSDTQFWSNQPDPVMIERGQNQAIQLVQNIMNPNTTTEPDTTETSTIPPMVCIDEEGLEEQFLIEDEASQEVADITMNRVTTPVDNSDVAPLDPIYTQRSQQEEDLDLHPSRGPKGESLVNVTEEFLDDNYEDVLRTSNIQTNFSITTNNGGITGTPNLPLSWIVPNGTNRTLEEI